MKPATFNRLHSLRMENDAARFDQEEIRPRFDRLANRHTNGSAPRAVVVHQLFQTPPDLAERLVALLGELPAGARVLEPSAGLGRLLDCIPRHCETVAVEIAADCARELFTQDRPGVKILQRDFLTLSPDDPALNNGRGKSGPGANLFDAVAMNPPFTMRADIRHILHARQFLKPGGRLAALCMDTRHRQEQLRPHCIEWHEIPAGAFKHEGTNIAAALILMESEK